MQLRPYQESCLTAITEAEARGVRRQLIVKPTGTGKTVTFASFLQSRPGRALVIAHRDELLSQARAKILAVNPDARIGIVRADLNQHHAEIVIASVQTLARERRLKKLTADFQTVIVDEAHHVKAETYGRILEYVAASDPLLLGFTATPYRGDGKPISRDDPHAEGNEWFEQRVFQMDIAEAVNEGWLAEPVGRLVYLKGADFNQLHTKRGDYDTSELEEMLRAANWQDHITRALQDHAADRQTVIFVPPKRVMAYELEKHLNTHGFRATAITGETELTRRRDCYHRFEARELNVLISVDVLTEGFDSPVIDCVMMARPTKSKTVYVQSIGRGLRINPGKANCLVLDLVGATVRHDLMTLSSLTGARRAMDGESFREAQARAKREAEEEQIRADELKRRIEAEHEARQINLLKAREWRASIASGADGERWRRWLWVNAPDGSATLQIPLVGGGRRLVVRPMADGASWLASDHRGWRAVYSTKDEAITAAEDFAQSLLPRRSTHELPTQKQLATLEKFRIRFDPQTITKKQASQLIGAKIEEFSHKRLRMAV